jgi:hypothetical protein
MDVDFKIDREGQWYHSGEIIKREALAKLFSDRALKIDAEGNYWLQTPYEKYPVEVEDVPYVIIDYNDQLTFKTNMNDTLSLNKNTHWQLRNGIPYVEVRDGLFARMGRSVLYNLVNTYGESVNIDGKIFSLGKTND